MKKKIMKIMSYSILCMAILVMPILLTGCGKEENLDKGNKFGLINTSVSIGDLSYSLTDYSYDTQTKNLEIILVIENYSDSDVEITGDSFRTSFGVSGSYSQITTVKANSVSTYILNMDCTGHSTGAGEHFVLLGNNVIGSMDNLNI